MTDDTLPGRLREPLVMSMFCRRSDLYREQEAQREEAADALDAAHAERDAALARLAELEGAVAKDLSDRMELAGMVPLDAMIKPDAMTKWNVHSGMTDLSFFMDWLERKAKQYGGMQAAHQTNVRKMDEDMFNFVMGKSGAFKEVLENARAALKGTPHD